MGTKKVIMPAAVAVLTLVTLVVGATYAYFTIATTNSFGTRTATATAQSVGSVALSTGSNISMALTRAHMSTGNAGTAYYATASGVSTTASSPTIGTATVTGDGTYSCNYSFTVSATATNSMYTVFQGMSTKSTDQIVLTINAFGSSTVMDFNTASLFPKTISGTVTGLTKSASKTVTAQLKVLNKDVDQTALAGTDITISIKADSFTCTATA